MRRSLFVLAAVLGTSLPRLVWAAVPTGAEFQINTFTIDSQGYPQICAGTSGNFVVTWESRGQDGGSNAVIARRFGSDGQPLGGEFQVNTYTSGNQQFPSIACDDGGNFVVVWEGRQQDGSSYGVFGQRFSSDGDALGTEFQVNTYTEERQLSAAVCRAPGGEFVVTWQSYDQDGDGYGVFGQRFADDGAQQGTEFQVNTYTYYTQEYPAVACDGQGDFVVVWVSDYQDGDGYGIFGQRFASSGALQGTEFQVHTYTYYSQESPAVAADTAGNFVVVWSSYQYQGGAYSYGIFGQRFGISGERLGTEFQVNTYTSYVQESPAVAVDPCGNFTVVWSGGGDGDGYGIFGQRFDTTGAPVGTQFQVNTYTTGDQGTFSALGHVVDIATDASGNFTVVWQSEDQPNDSSSFGIFGQQFETDSCSAACVGDCNRDGFVTTNELVLSVDIALEIFPVSSCPAINSSGTGVVTIEQLLTAVNASLHGCP